ncbi:MAG: MMPL family transporter [Pirellulales bacterium]|nr:MMPL family transporter [Pirellulales bacterium]
MHPAAFANWYITHRRWVAALVVVLTALSIVGVFRLELDDVPRSVFKTDNADYAQLLEFLDDFESDDNDCLLVIDGGDLFTPRGAGAIRQLVDGAKQIPGVSSVRSLGDVVSFGPGGAESLLPPADAPPERFATARQRALAHPLVRGQVLSPDARTALVIVRLDGDLEAIHDIEPVVDSLHDVARQVARDSGLRVELTGVPGIRVQIFNQVPRETGKFIIVGAVLALLMAYFLFRQVWSALIVASAPILGAFWTMGALGLVGEKLNVINTMLPTLVMVVGFADSMHLMMDIRLGLAEGMSCQDASRAAVRHLTIALLLTSSTTAIGFGSLALAEVDIIRRFGLACAGGSMLSMIAVLSLIPLLASTWLGEHVRAAHGQDFFTRNFAYFQRYIDWIVDHAWPVTIGGIAVTALLATSMFWLEPDNRLLEMIPRNDESYVALRRCDTAFGGTLSAFVLVEWPERLTLGSPVVLGALGAAEDVMRSEPGVHHPLSVLGLLAALPGPEGDLALRVPLLQLAPADVRNRYVREDIRRALVVARLPDSGIATNRPVFARIETQLAALGKRYPDLKFTLTGTAVVGSRNVYQMIESLNSSLLGASLAIFGSIALGFRSLRLAAISVPPNIFPLVGISTLLVVTGRSLQMTSVMVFSICLGIAVDDTIHFLNRFRRELVIDGDVRAAIRRSFLAVGSAVFTTTLVLLVGFGSVLTSAMPSSRLFAGLSCAAYTMAIAGDLVMLPALIVCFVKPPKVTQPAAAADVPAAEPAMEPA